MILLLAPVLAGAIALASERAVPPVASPPYKAKTIVWSDRVFTERRDLARWLRYRGKSYRVWAKRHPGGVRIFRRIDAIERPDARRRSG